MAKSKWAKMSTCDERPRQNTGCITQYYNALSIELINCCVTVGRPSSVTRKVSNFLDLGNFEIVGHIWSICSRNRISNFSIRFRIFRIYSRLASCFRAIPLHLRHTVGVIFEFKLDSRVWIEVWNEFRISHGPIRPYLRLDRFQRGNSL